MTGVRVLLVASVVVLAALLNRSATNAPDLVPSAAAPVWTPVTTQQLSHGRFAKFTVYAPHGSPRGFVLLLSGAEGWTPRLSELAMRLAADGAMIAAIDVAQLDAALEADPSSCVFPDGDLENLSHFVQAYYRLPTYLTPLLGGESAGGALAYATLAQAPDGTFAGAVSMDFCPRLELRKLLCKSAGLDYGPAGEAAGVSLLPAKQLRAPWTVLQRASGTPAGVVTQPCAAETVPAFVTQIPNARLIQLQRDADRAPDVGVWPAQTVEAFDALVARNAPTAQAMAPRELADLPIIAVAVPPNAPPSDTLAIMLSGDGGWAGLDKDVATALTADGVSVVGLDSLRYFWSARTPEGLAADLDRMILYYLRDLGKRRVILIGYSQGADVLPFAVNRLSTAARAQVALAALMGMSEHALFEFHMTSWISDDNSGPATLPEVQKMTGTAVLCVYGEDESDSLCPRLDARRVDIVKLKGGHHFDGNYDALARIILASARH